MSGDAIAGRGYMLRAAKADWRTPPEIIAAAREAMEGGISLDPCASSNPDDWFADVNLPGPTGSAHDGLNQGWHGAVYANPPFGELAKWTAKAHEQAKTSSRAIVMLLPARTDTAYWHTDIATADLVCLLRGRLRFVGAPAPCPFPTAIAYWGQKPALFEAVFSRLGMVFAP